MLNYYRSFKFNRLTDSKYNHLLLLLFWPAFGVVFSTLERLDLDYHIVSCSLDAKIPFCEYFAIPYYFWFAFMVGMLIYSVLFDIPTFKRYMKYIILTYSITLVTYIIYPTSQELRPIIFEDNNIFISIIKRLYAFDTNTNVCPSMHVIGSLAVYFSARKSKHFSSKGWRLAFCIAALSICVSTVFLKQHSVVDVVAAFVLCAVTYPFIFSSGRIEPSISTDALHKKKIQQYV